MNNIIDRLSVAIHEESAAIAPHTSALIEAARAGRDEIERLRYVLGGVRDAIKTGRNEPLVIWKEQIDIALGGYRLARNTRHTRATRLDKKAQ